MRGPLRRALFAAISEAPRSFETLRIAERPPHPRFARPLPARGGKVAKQSRSRDAVFDSHPSYRQANRKNLAANRDLRQIDPAVEGRIHHGRARHGADNARKKKEAERRKAQCHAPPRLHAARVQRDAHAFRRSTAALARGTIHPQGSASGHASWDLAGAFGPVRPPQPGSGDLALLRGRYPRRKTCPSPAMHLARRSLCRQDDAQAAREPR
jgi:hypothetical protein